VISLASLDAGALANAWRAGRPFPHVIVDDLVSPQTLQALLVAVAGEPHWPNRSELYEMMASGVPAQPALQAFASALGSAETRTIIEAITGRRTARVEVRSYVYLAGSYLLPHSDWKPGIDRQVAYAFYLASEGCDGGELQLFECSTANGEIVATAPAARVGPRPNRLVLFDVSPTSVHQVREVLAGARLSLAGWFS
jgi:Rps23 Pro-64 3,4-dihydroxylase Tpa1-like proline 4-hydroxylase